LDQTDLEDAKQPWKMRYCALQNVTLNLPRIAYLAKGEDSKLFSKIAEFVEMAVKAHLEKKLFIEKLLSLGEKGPLALLAMDRDGSPYLRMHRASFLVGMVGLNELVQIHTGQEMHQSKQAFKFGLKAIAHMKLLVDKFSRRYGMRFVLEQTPAESTAYRFAKLDLKFHSPKSGHIVKGDISKGEIYYTNSTYLNNSAVLNPIERVRQEGLFHPLIEAGALTHIWLGEARPSKSSLANFVTKTFQLTQNDQIAFSPEFTTCNGCHRTSRGLRSSCIYCGSEDVDGITRITGYFTKVSSWNKGKIGELRNRYRNQTFLEKTEEETALET
jgi:ribonucleoside-triphosphate reductase